MFIHKVHNRNFTNSILMPSYSNVVHASHELSVNPRLPLPPMLIVCKYESEGLGNFIMRGDVRQTEGRPQECSAKSFEPYLFALLVYRCGNYIPSHHPQLILSTVHTVSNFLGAGDVWFSLRNKTFPNISNVILDDIGDRDDALLCKTNFTACCKRPYTGENGSSVGNWFFPNGTIVPSSGTRRDIYRTRGHMMVHLNRRRGGVAGIYRCEIPDSMNVTQTMYIGVYTASTGESALLYS